MKGFFKKLISLTLLFFMMLSTIGLNNIKAEDENPQDENSSWEIVENNNEHLVNELANKIDLNEEEETTFKGNVRVSIVLEDASTLEKGFEKENLLDADAIAYRQSLNSKQETMESKISKEVLKGEKLDVVWNLTLAANIISANVPYDKIEEIKNVSGVKDVVIENQYEPHTDEVQVDDPQMSTATDMTSAQFAWAGGYTGAGKKVAIVDTGLDVDHISFDPLAFESSITVLERKLGKKIELLDGSDLKKYWSFLNASSKKQSYLDAYVNSKVPFAYNYVDKDFQVDHLNDLQGEHGSHVASISAANKYIVKEDEVNGNIVMENAITSVRTQGNAPDAQILVMKVFGKGGGAYDSDYFSAIEDAIVLGADSVNLSLGSSVAGFSYDRTYAELIESLKEVNIIWANSAGNSGSWADATDFGFLYSEDKNLATGGSPATYETTLSVASVDNVGFTSPYFLFDNEMIFYTEPAFGQDDFVTLKGTQSFVFVDSVGTADEFKAIKEVLTDKIAICKRGSISFYQKADNAVANGAIATIIVNNAAGTLGMNIEQYAYTKPCIGITQSDGNSIKAGLTKKTATYLDKNDKEVTFDYYEGEIEVSDEIVTTVSSPSFDIMSDFSSFGVPGDLSLKPEITAPGGNIYAAFGLNKKKKDKTIVTVGGHDKYENMSGTSMASPQIAGIVALLSQYLDDTDFVERLGLSKRTIIQSLLMSTARPLVEEQDGGTGYYYSILKQGAGLADVEAAINSTVLVLVDNVQVNGEDSKVNKASNNADGKVKAELGDDPDRSGKYSVTFTVYNLTDEERYYELDGEFFTQDIFDYYGMSFLNTWTTGLDATLEWYQDGLKITDDTKYDFNNDGTFDDKDAQALLDYVVGKIDSINDLDKADLDQDEKVTTYDAYLALKLANKANLLIPASGKTQIKVDITLNDIDLFDKNGAYVEGYLFLTEKESKDGALGVEHSIPVLGYYGSWAEPSMIDVGSLLEYGYKLEDRPPYMYNEYALGKTALSTKAQTFIVHHNEFDINYGLGGNPLGADFDYDGSLNAYYPERNALNSENSIVGARYSLIRNSVGYQFELSDSAATIDSKEVVSNDYAAFYSASQGAWQNTSAIAKYGNDISNLVEGKEYNIALSLAPEYYLEQEIAWEAIDPNMELSFVIDNTKPTIIDITSKRDVVTEVDGEGNETILENTIKLNIAASDNEYIAGLIVYDEKDKVLHKVGSRIGDKTDVNDERIFDIEFDGNEVSDHLYVEVWDYAANVVTAKINLNKEELEGEIGITLNKKEAISIVGSTITLVASITPWAYPNQEVLWSSSDESVATVENGQVKGLKVGEAIITATAKADTTKMATCKVIFEEIDKNLKGLVWDEEGKIWLSSFNTKSLPTYNKLSPNLGNEIASLTYDKNGTLYAASFDSENWISSLYTLNEQTYELTLVGTTTDSGDEYAYMDIAAANGLGADKLVGIYGYYVGIIDKATGLSEGWFSFGDDTDDNYFVGIAYAGTTLYSGVYYDFYYLVDEVGKAYLGIFYYNKDTYNCLDFSLVDKFGYQTDTPYYQSLYYDGKALYWSLFNEADNRVDLIYTKEDFKNVYNLGSFDDGVWPVGGLYNDDLKALINPPESSSSTYNLEENKYHFQTEAPQIVIRNKTKVKGSTNNLEDNIVLKNASAKVEKEGSDDYVVVELMADGSVKRSDETLFSNNELFEVSYDVAKLEFVSIASSEKYHSYVTPTGKIRFGFISLEGVDKDEVVATIKFKRLSEEKITINAPTLENNEDFVSKPKELVIESKYVNVELVVNGEGGTATLNCSNKVLRGDKFKLTLNVQSGYKAVVEVNDVEVEIKSNVTEFTADKDYKIVVTFKPNVLAQSIKLNKEKASLEVNKSTTLKATVLPEDTFDKTVKWSSSNNKIATVDENGKVTAIKTGQVEIKATTSNGLEAKCKVTVILPKVKLVDIYNSANGADIRFKAIENATHYVIMRKESGVWKTIKTLKASEVTKVGSSLQYIDTAIKNQYGKGYIYSVAAKDSNGTYAYDTVGLAIYRLKQPTIKTISSNSKGSVTLTWDKVDAHGYEIQYSLDNGKTWTKVKETKDTSITITGLKSNTKYTFRMRCQKTNPDRGVGWSPYSAWKAITVK